MIEPTETKSRETLDRFIEAMEQVYNEAINQPETVRQRTYTLHLD